MVYYFFKKADRKKINRKEFEDMIEGSYINGALFSLSRIAGYINDEKNKGVSIDIILGEIQLMVREMWNDFAKGPGRGRTLKMDEIEYVVENKDPQDLIIRKYKC